MSAVAVVAAVLAVAGGVGVIASRRPVRSVLSLLLTLLSLAVLFIGLGAEFIGLIQIIVYAGAVMVLFVFVISLLSAKNEPLERPVSLLPGQERWGGVAAAVLAVLLIVAGLRHAYPAARSVFDGYGAVRAFGEALFYEHVFVLQLAALLLMVAVVGVVILIARRS
ncbi:MAG: NADH-quinone oxidoreductase subunit J [Bacillota bacterium]|nr:MAG: NADH-quinone oxidoreductase subunit J [Bacillota bacterium]